MKKILITGGLGYIGTELCKLYAKESNQKKIVVLDNKFLSERVKQLQDWGIEYIHGDILDTSLMEWLLPKFDIIHHLAGITDVAHTKGESNNTKDTQIKKVGVEGTRNIIKYSSNDVKIIFSSTHVIFEGYEETIYDIGEEGIEPKAVLTYSKGKLTSENDLIDSNKNYVILRLGSNYGYSNDSMRLNIMPNLFSKITSQNGTIKLFGGGKQYKSVVAVFDVARCLKFISERDDISNEVFNCTNENLTVKDVSEICKSINPKIKVIETDDEIPNLGYTVSNKKILSTGFEFIFNINQSIKEMIMNWSMTRPDNENLEYKIFGEKEYIDDRGKISNFELYEPINWIGMISSKAGSVRANHYHPIQTQQVLLVSGKYISVFKDLDDNDAIIQTQIINAGEVVVTKPNVAHTMVFVEDSVILNLVNGEREHENYGVHTLPYILVDEKLRKNLLTSFKEGCRSCENKKLTRIVNLGLSPLANNLLDSEDEEYNEFPLELDYCDKCKNVQLSNVVPPEQMYDNYLYVSSTSKSFREHFKLAAEKYIKEFNLNENSFVVDIGSNDGIGLKPFIDNNITVLGIEPAINVAEIANNNGIPTMNNYYDDYIDFPDADLILASNVFAHGDKLKEMALKSFSSLKENGRFIIEVQYLVDTINDVTFDNIYHEHVNYWTVTSLLNFVNNITDDYTILDVEHINTHGGSIRVTFGKIHLPISNNVETYLKDEERQGFTTVEKYLSFGDTIKKSKIETNKKIDKYKKEGKRIVGYGSPAKATTLLNYYNISNIDYIVEDNPLKHGKYLPINNPIKIVSKETLENDSPDVILVLAWNFYNEIVKNNEDIVNTEITEFTSIKSV